jgi:hypothetical protein
MKITAYKCEDTGQVFEHLKDYRTHRAKISRQLKKERLWREKALWLKSKWQEMYNAVSTIQEFEQWVTDNWDVFEENYRHQAYYIDRRCTLPKLVQFTVIQSHYVDGIWKCQAKLQLSADTPSFISNYFRFDDGPFETSSGGGSHKNYNQYFHIKSEKFHVLTTRYLLTKEPE